MIWDNETIVFTSSSDIPGLVVETDTFEEFVSLVEALAPGMHAANLPYVTRPYCLDIQSHRSFAVAWLPKDFYRDLTKILSEAGWFEKGVLSFSGIAATQ